MNRKLSSLIFLIIIIMFSFPWVMVSCGGQPLTTATGFQALSGNYVGNYSNMMGQYSSEIPKSSPNFWLILAIIVAVIGVITGLTNGDKIIDRTLVWLSSIESALLTIFPLHLLGMIQSSLKSSGSSDEFGMGMESMIKISFRPAFFIALFLSIGCIFLNAYFLKSSYGQSSSEVSSETLTKPEGINSSDYVFCPNCGAKNLKGNKFCSSCGAKLP